VGQNQSSIFDCKHGVPQGTVLEPMLFTLYVVQLAKTITWQGDNHTQSADDVQFSLYRPIVLNDIKLHPCCAAASTVCMCKDPEKTEATAVGTPANVLMVSLVLLTSAKSI